MEKTLFCNKRSKYMLVDDLYYLVFVWWSRYISSEREEISYVVMSFRGTRRGWGMSFAYLVEERNAVKAC